MHQPNDVLNDRADDTTDGADDAADEAEDGTRWRGDTANSVQHLASLLHEAGCSFGSNFRSNTQHPTTCWVKMSGNIFSHLANGVMEPRSGQALLDSFFWYPAQENITEM